MSLYNFSQNEFTNNLKTEELGLRKKTEARLTAEAKVTPLEKTVQGLKNLGIKVTPSMVESMANLDKADSPRLKAQLSIIEKAVAEGTLKPEEGLKRVNDVFTDFQKGKQAVRDQTEIVDGIKAESKAGKLPALIDFLKNKRGYTDAALAPLFEEAGVQMPASATPATTAPAAAPAAAVSPRTGLSSGRQQKYGPLTPMATIEADALAGNSTAIAYLKQLAEDAKNRDRAKTENAMRAAQGE
jgi:polyhydroxyalkanoate synthesis regulator phasin